MRGLFVLFLTLFAGCVGGEPCADLCEEQNMCPGVTARECATFCAAQSALAAEAGCTMKFNALVACEDAIFDEHVCTDGTCRGDEADLVSCLGPYCDAHADDPACAPPPL